MAFTKLDEALPANIASNVDNADSVENTHNIVNVDNAGDADIADHAFPPKTTSLNHPLHSQVGNQVGNGRLRWAKTAHTDQTVRTDQTARRQTNGNGGNGGNATDDFYQDYNGNGEIDGLDEAEISTFTEDQVDGGDDVDGGDQKTTTLIENDPGTSDAADTTAGGKGTADVADESDEPAELPWGYACAAPPPTRIPVPSPDTSNSLGVTSDGNSEEIEAGEAGFTDDAGDAGDTVDNGSNLNTAGTDDGEGGQRRLVNTMKQRTQRREMQEAEQGNESMEESESREGGKSGHPTEESGQEIFEEKGGVEGGEGVNEVGEPEETAYIEIPTKVYNIELSFDYEIRHASSVTWTNWPNSNELVEEKEREEDDGGGGFFSNWFGWGKDKDKDKNTNEDENSPTFLNTSNEDSSDGQNILQELEKVMVNEIWKRIVANDEMTWVLEYGEGQYEYFSGGGTVGEGTCGGLLIDDAMRDRREVKTRRDSQLTRNRMQRTSRNNSRALTTLQEIEEMITAEEILSNALTETKLLALSLVPPDQVSSDPCTSSSSSIDTCTLIHGKLAVQYSGSNEYGVVHLVTELVKQGCEEGWFIGFGSPALMLEFVAATGTVNTGESSTTGGSGYGSAGSDGGGYGGYGGGYGGVIPVNIGSQREEVPQEEEENYISKYGKLFVSLLAILGVGFLAAMYVKRKRRKRRLKESREESMEVRYLEGGGVDIRPEKKERRGWGWFGEKDKGDQEEVGGENIGAVEGSKCLGVVDSMESSDVANNSHLQTAVAAQDSRAETDDDKSAASGWSSRFGKSKKKADKETHSSNNAINANHTQGYRDERLDLVETPFEPEQQQQQQHQQHPRHELSTPTDLTEESGIRMAEQYEVESPGQDEFEISLSPKNNPPTKDMPFL